MKTEALCSSETLVAMYKTVWHHIPEESDIILTAVKISEISHAIISVFKVLKQWA
jgi:hypothetical protein